MLTEKLTKKCTHCKIEKLLSLFYRSRNRPDGRTHECKVCSQERDQKRKTYSVAKNATLKAHFGISLADYYTLYIAQDCVCKICKKPETCLDASKKKTRSLAVDHCHTTGEIRGLLCSKCNQGLGLFNDNLDLLTEATNYLKKSHDNS